MSFLGSFSHAFFFSGGGEKGGGVRARVQDSIERERGCVLQRGVRGRRTGSVRGVSVERGGGPK